MPPVAGQKYYRCGLDISTDIAEPVIETLVYQGYFELDHNSASCDEPYHFYQFAHYGQEQITLNVPSLRTVERDYLSFAQLMHSLPIMVNEMRELNVQKELKDDSPKPTAEK